MKKRSTLVALFLALALGIPANGLAAGKGDDLGTAMQRLWEDPITWTRLSIVSALADLLDNGATTARLLQNQTADVAAYDRIHQQILEMADMLSDGILKQFPEKAA
jgi:hypothetical protein